MATLDYNDHLARRATRELARAVVPAVPADDYELRTTWHATSAPVDCPDEREGWLLLDMAASDDGRVLLLWARRKTEER